MTVTGGDWLKALLLLATPLFPLALLLPAWASRSWRRALPWLLGVAPLPGLAAALFARGTAVWFDESRLQIGLLLDSPRALLLGSSSLLWALAGAFTASFMRDDPRRHRFVVAWLLSQSGCLGVFLAADLAGFYLLYALVSLAAWGLVVHDGTPMARRAATIYVALAVAGEACLLVAFVLLAAAGPSESLRIDVAIAALPEFPRRGQTIVFLLLGFGLKAGLVPLHGWLPLAHPAAPAPGSAVLSGAIIKTGVIGLIAFLPLAAGDGGWGPIVIAIGFLTAFYTAGVGLTQENLKVVLAYSSASQMGVVAALIGVGLSRCDPDAGTVAAFYALHHVLVKGALFLGVGLLAVASPGQHRWLVLLLILLGLSIPGLPLSGGAIAKLATKDLFDTAPLKILALGSSIASGAIMLHFALGILEKAPAPGRRAALPVLLPWVALLVAAVVVPWWLFSGVSGRSASEALGLGAVWAGLWPIAIGALALAGLMAWWARRRPVACRGSEGIPAGDLLVPCERACVALARGTSRFDLVDRLLAQWWVAGLLLVGMVLTLGLLARGS